MADLKACPFCGSKEINLHSHGRIGQGPSHRGEVVYTIGCYQCGASFPGMYDEHGRNCLMAKWNARAPDGAGEAVAIGYISQESLTGMKKARSDREPMVCHLASHELYGNAANTVPLFTHPVRARTVEDALDAARLVYDTFARDLKQGYRTRDKVFAVDILGQALSLPTVTDIDLSTQRGEAE